MAQDEGVTKPVADNMSVQDEGITRSVSVSKEDGEDGDTRRVEVEIEGDSGVTQPMTDTEDAAPGLTQPVSQTGDKQLDGTTTEMTSAETAGTIAQTDEGGTRPVSELQPVDSGTTRVIPHAVMEDGSTTPIPEKDIAIGEAGTTKPLIESPIDKGMTNIVDDPLITASQGSLASTVGGYKNEDVTDHRGSTIKPGPQLPKQDTFEGDDLKKPNDILGNRYRILGILGRGGFGAAYLAEDTHLNRLCAVKQMLPKKRPKNLEIYHANFQREAQLLVQLNDPGHPNIPEIYDYFFNEDVHYLVMKYIEGRDLKQMMDADEISPAHWPQVVRYGVELCSALDYMSRQSEEPVMHRDIKPSNVVLGNDNRIWLLDFGLAKVLPIEDINDVTVSKAYGSVGYTALEQWLGRATPASDIYALGAMVHHLLTGISPVETFGREFTIRRLQEMHGQFTPIRKINRNIPRELEETIASCTASDPEQRPTALQLQSQLQACISEPNHNTPLFTFKSGDVATEKSELVDLCDRYRPEAQEYLYRGDFERWFRLINRNDLADAAIKGVKQGKNRKEGLEKFLKLVMPNLVLRRLMNFVTRFTGEALKAGVIVIAVVALLLLLGSSIIGLRLERTIGNYPWNFYVFDTERDNIYNEDALNSNINEVIGSGFELFKIDLKSAETDGQVDDLVIVEMSLLGADRFVFPFTVQLDKEKPQVQLDTINGIPFFWVSDNIANGINRGVDQALAEAPLKFTKLDIKETALVVTATKTDDWDPENLSSRPSSLASSETALLIVTNELTQTVTLEIDGQSWPIADGLEAIKLPKGIHNYAIFYERDDRLVSEGQKDWSDFDFYELRITK